MTAIRPRNVYTEENLRPAVATAKNLGEVLANLGLEDRPKRRRYVSEQIKAVGIDTSHFSAPGMLYTEQDLRKAVADSQTMVEVATKLGARPVGGTIHHLRRRIVVLGLGLRATSSKTASREVDQPEVEADECRIPTRGTQARRR